LSAGVIKKFLSRIYEGSRPKDKSVNGDKRPIEG